MIGTLTRDMSTSIVGSGENVQSSEYVYDHMGRLMTGSIEFVGKVGNKYDVSTSYNKAGGLESKVSSPDASAQVFAGTSQEMTYDLTYQYSGTNPHQLSEVISSQGVPYAMSFAYNASGSISEITDMMGVDHSSYYWGQEQWLCGVENTQGIHHYVYDHAGERIMKSSITQTTVQLNDETINTVTTLEPYTLYVNPYYVVTSFSNADQRSKHYYMGTQRVATDIGVDYGMSPSPEQTERAHGRNATTAGETTQGLETDQVPFQSLGYEQDLERVLLGLSGEIGVEDLSEALVPIESFYPDLSAGVNSGEGIESELPLYIGTRIMYWYHPDYVSNVDMVTDKSGEAYELFLYNAWGESLHHWTSSSTNSWSSPYRFNSKELDSETGMHYYGARYHHPKLSVWMSVDPLAHQTLEAYQFTGNNPIALIDPDGRCPDCPNGEYQIQEGDTFWDLEAKWNMDHGSLSQMNPALNPRALQIGQSIRTVLNESDLPNGVQLHSSNSLNGMDNFFIPGAEGVNKLRIISDEEYNDLINQLAAGNPRDAAWGEQGDAKMQFINNKDQYSNNTQAWFNDQNSVTEPATRYLFIYQNYAYNINEFGNLAFGSANSKTGNVSLNTLLIGGHVYSLFMNGQWDDINEVRAVKRGYKLYPGYQSKQFNGDYIPYMP